MIRNVAILSLLLTHSLARAYGTDNTGTGKEDSANSGRGPMFATYTAEITELNGSGVTATAIVFAGNVGGFIGYGGFAEGLESSLQAEFVSQRN
jgi:hypothetical protein